MYNEGKSGLEGTVYQSTFQLLELRDSGLTHFENTPYTKNSFFFLLLQNFHYIVFWLQHLGPLRSVAVMSCRN